MHKQIMGLAATALILALTLASTARAAVHEPYVPDLSFGTNGVVYDPLVKFVPQDPFRASGERAVVDRHGNTVVAGMGQMWSMLSSEWVNYLVVVRYGPDGQRMKWFDATPGYSDATQTYLYLPPGFTPQAPDHALITAVADIKFAGPYSDIYILVDALESGTGSTTDSMVVTFSESGAYKGTVTHMAKPGVDDVGAALVPVPGYKDLLVVSSARDTVTAARYSLEQEQGLPVLETTWGSGGRANQTLFKCRRYLSQIHDWIIVPCDLRARRAIIGSNDDAGLGFWVYVAGEYANDQGGSAAPQSDMFIMQLNTYDGRNEAPYPVTWNSPDTEDSVRGLAYRSMYDLPYGPGYFLYVLDAFPRPCRSGFIVGRFNVGTGAFIDRTWTSGGGSDTDPNVCGTTSSLEATDMILPKTTQGANRYLAVVGSRFSGEPYTGQDAFMALIDTQNMHTTPQVQTFTHNASQWPDDAGFNAVSNDFRSDAIVATGWRTNPEWDGSEALTIRMRPDRIFTNGYESN